LLTPIFSQTSVVADIGSSDLWISSGQSIADNTNTDVNLTYGIGLAYNNVTYTPVSFGGYKAWRI
jgi:hypothetical protein